MATSPATAPEIPPRALGLPLKTPFRDGPRDRCRGGRKMSIHKGACCECTASEGAPCIKAEPADPQQAGSHDAEHHRVGRHVLFGVTESFAEV